MKKIYLVPFAAFAIFTTSCKKDDESVAQLQEVVENAAEDQALDIKAIADGISSERGERKDGNPPAANGKINFKLESDKQYGYQEAGVIIEFTQVDDFAGAYIQLKSADGTVDPTYFDIPKRGFKAAPQEENRRGSKLGQKEEEQTESIELDFDDTIPPGTFCYVICVYDNDGNISEPQEACVEVEAWGGNPNLIGNWKLVKERYTDYETKEIIEVAKGEKYCDDYVLTCYNQGNETKTFENADCETTQFIDVNFNEDGTFTSASEHIYDKIDHPKSSETCSLIIEKDQIDTYTSKGQWSFNEDTQEIVLVELSSTDNGTLEIEEDRSAETWKFRMDTTSSLVLDDSNEDDGIYELHFTK